MTELAKYRELWDDMDETLKAYRQEATEQRDAVGEPELTDNVTDLHARLVSTRRAQDRTERILANVGLVRSRVRKLVHELEAAYDDKWRETMLNTRTGEYMSGKSQDATYAAGAMQELINVRRAKRMLADVEEVYEYVNLMHRGLDSSRRDTDTRIKLINLESQLEH